MKIVFTDIYGNETGYYTIDGDEITPSHPGAADFLEDFLANGKTAQDFIEKYSDYSSGYFTSEAVTE